jgi:plastocyanin
VRRLLVTAVVICALSPGIAVYAVSALGAPKADGTLLASVGPGMTISLTTQAGAPVSHLDPGTYDIQINDQSAEHNFHLFGPGGVSAGTEIEFVGIRTVTVTLGDGSFTFVCDPHAYDMIGRFTVGSGGGTNPPPPPPPPGGGAAGKLVGTVGPGMTISLTKSGAKVRSLKAGKYTITVRDRSPFHDFHLKGPGVNKKTGVGYRGTQTWTVTLKSGRYNFFCAPHQVRMHGSFRVT